MKYIKLFLFLICMTVNWSCQSQKINKKNISTGLMQVICSQYGGPLTPKIEVIKDEKALVSFFGEINRIRKPGLAIPKIDFSKEIILVSCLGEQNNNASATLEILSESNNRIELGMHFSVNKDPSISVITQAFCVYKIVKTTKELVFRKVQVN